MFFDQASHAFQKEDLCFLNNAQPDLSILNNLKFLELKSPQELDSLWGY